MAQHDYVIANGTGAAVRSDLNNGLAAIVSQNSGTTEPTTTYAYMRWADTTAGVMKMRNGANNAWITLYQLDGEWSTIAFENGSASAPSIYFKDSGTDTGIYSPGTDQVAISTGGSGRLFVDSSGNVTINGQGDLRLADSDSSNWVAFQAPATVASNVTWTLPAADGTSAQVLSTNGSGTLSWASVSSDKISEGNTEAEVVDTGSDGHFKVTTEGSERLRVDPSGRLLVGTSTALTGTNPQYAKLVSIGNTAGGNGPGMLALGASSAASGIASGDNIGRIFFTDNAAGEYANITCQADAAGGTNDYPGRLVFSTTADGASSPTERMRIDQNGNIKTYSTGNGHTVNVSAGAGTSTFIYAGNRSSTDVQGSGGTTVYYVYSNGTVQNATGTYTTISDAKLKENIVDANSQWDDLKAIQIRNWNFKAETGHETHRQIGPIAQELEAVCPGLVFETPDRDEDGNETGKVTKGVNQSVLYMKAVKALQEAMERIEQLESEMAAIKAQLS